MELNRARKTQNEPGMQHRIFGKNGHCKRIQQYNHGVVSHLFELNMIVCNEVLCILLKYTFRIL